MSKRLTRKLGGYSMLAGLAGGFFYMMASDIGYRNALLVVGVCVFFFAFLTLAVYLIME